MKIATRIRLFLLLAIIAVCPTLPIGAATPIRVDTRNLQILVDPINCRWSAEVKGTPMQLNDVHFLPNDDSSGWTAASSVNNDDANNLGSFVTVTLRGAKPGQLDFDYQISASKTGNDILVSLGRSNNTGKAVDIEDMDYFVSSDARLGGSADKWIAIGTQSRNRDYYELGSVINLITPRTYEVNHVVRDSDTGNSLLLGHVTALKGASRFEVGSGWQGKNPDRMRFRGYCSGAINRTSEDADGGYELGVGYKHLLTESLLGTAIRFFYSGRVFWNDGDGFHIYRFNPNLGSNGRFNYGEGKVSANIHAIAANVLFVSEAFNEKYPEDRIELLKRISPPTMDVAYPVDLFVRKPAQIWNMPVERPFGKWSILAVFNYSNTMAASQNPPQFSTSLEAAKDLRLQPDKEYLVYEFWSKKFIGIFRGTFITRPLNSYDCDIYSIVEKQNQPVLVSTSRHVRQMAFDIKDLAYDGQQRVLRGTSRAVAGDPYQLRIYVPDGFTAKRVELSDGLTPKMSADEHLLTVDYMSSTGNDVEWKVFF